MPDNFAKDVAAWTDGWQVLRSCVLVLAAVMLGGVLGFERAWRKKEAGLRTHMLVTLGAALFALVSQAHGGTPAELSRVIQGVATGVGFLGAGAILKLTEKEQVFGLTTAGSIWVATGVGIAVGA